MSRFIIIELISDSSDSSDLDLDENELKAILKIPSSDSE